VAVLDLLTYQVTQMIIESTNDQLTDNTDITYNECYAQVFLGDCLELYKNIEPKSIDLILTDLPYGTTACKWDTIIPFDKLWEMVNYLLKPNGAFITTASQPFTSALVMSNPKMFKYALVWNKMFGSNFGNVNIMPLKFHEDICLFYNKPPVYNKQMTKREKPIDARNWKNDKKYSNVNLQGIKNQQGTSKLYEYKNPTSIIEYSSVGGECNNLNRIHPTQKPVALFEYLLKTYSNKLMTIFDPCMGSGTTGVACKNINRNFIGIEKDENYFKIAEQRINARTLFS
jgi:site-specific DNA-methyltransferase (adenine-specific)